MSQVLPFSLDVDFETLENLLEHLSAVSIESVDEILSDEDQADINKRVDHIFRSS